LIVGTDKFSAARWLGIPTVPFVESNSAGSFSLKDLKFVIVNTHYENSVNTEGETLIPPTLKEFAETFSDDLSTTLGLAVPVKTSHYPAKDSIFITLGNSSTWLDAAGRPTSEGYTIDVTNDGITITGASPLGAWWATRSILQQGVLNSEMELSIGSAKDAPGWGIRGAFVSLFLTPENFLQMY
jgi:hexosaminidase